MTYQALARKWRPKTFAELVGQAHVVTALANALERGRVHHAYLLTGTRGVGKTTIARLLAKSLNCVTGVTATPCGTCSACTDIDAGRFVDLLELDAASNTQVDQMREILDNARYAPTVGRYKVYLIDEVHQLSRHSFNAMLKTLEEPPEHVKFVLATTEPEKVPVTVLSRCLQFNLKPLPPGEIGARVETILEAEGVPRDAAAVALIARAARGSMRDGLSLLDQAIAFGGGQVREQPVRSMLGAVDRDYIYRIADALVANDGKALLVEADALAARGLSAESALEEVASLFHRIAIAQVVPDACEQFDDAERVAAFAAGFTPEFVQLAYQIAAQGRADLAIAPDDATGFSMTLLRMLAFEPAPQGGERQVAPVARTVAMRPRPGVDSRPAAAAVSAVQATAAAPPATPIAEVRPLPLAPADWPGFVAGLRLSGIVAQLAAQTELRSVDGRLVNLALPPSHKHLADRAYADKLQRALEQATGLKLMLAFEVGVEAPDSLAAKERRERDRARSAAEAAFRDEPIVRALVERFDGTVRADSIKSLGGDKP